MPRIVMAGLARELASWLEDRLTGVKVSPTHDGAGTLDELSKGECSLLVINNRITGPDAPEVVNQARERLGLLQLPVIYCLQQAPEELAKSLRAEHFLVHPIDREEMARQAAEVLQLPPDLFPDLFPDLLPDSSMDGVAAGEKAPTQQALSTKMARIWEQTKPAVMTRLEVLEQATAALLEGNLDLELRRLAGGEAHKLYGLLGTFGYRKASQLAKEAEKIFEDVAPLGQAEALSLSKLAVSLRDELERQLDLGIGAEPDQAVNLPAQPADPFFLVVDDDAEVAQLVAGEAAARGVRAEIAPDTAKARDIISRSRPGAVLLDLTFPEGTEDSLALLSELSGAKPPVPVLVLTGRDTFIDRVEVARRGGRGFLAKSLPLPQVLDAVTELMGNPTKTEPSVVIVDDDPNFLTVVEALLEGEGFQVKTLEDPRQFWRTLEASSPRALILDVDMPHIDGIDLCRVVRNDPKWGGLPVMFVTAGDDAEVMTRAFAAGADDFLHKRKVKDELAPRIVHRMSSKSPRGTPPNVDSAEGPDRRERSAQGFIRLLDYAGRYSQPVTLAMIGLDKLEQFDEWHGTSAGDDVVKRLAGILTRSFHGDDVVSQWSRSQFVVGMYGMNLDDGVQRAAEALEALRDERFEAPDGSIFRAAFSAGVSTFPLDGKDFWDLQHAAKEAMARAKTAGGDRVLSTGPTIAAPGSTQAEGQSEELETFDVVLVDDDEALASVVLHSLETRGYSTKCLRDGGDAADSLAGADLILRARLVLLDVNLPGLNGLGVLRRLNRDLVLQRTRVIMLTARSAESEVSEPLELGAYDFVAKPFSLQLLMQRVRRALSA